MAICQQHKRDAKGNLRWSTDEEKMAVLQKVDEQLTMALRIGRVTCADCGNEFELWRVYRCYYCGRYYGVCCAGDHFGGSRFRK